MKNLNDIWRLYMRNYDAVLSRFPAYNALHGDIMNHVRQIVDTLPEKNILIIDLGCGTGNLTKQLVLLQQECKFKKIRITGIDNNDEALQLAKRKTGDCAEFYKSDIGDMKTDEFNNIIGKDGAVRIAILVNVFFSLKKEQKENLICTLKASMGDDGVIIISEPHNPISLKKIINETGGIFKFICAVIPIFFQLLVVLYVNYRYLAGLVSPAAVEQKMFATYGFVKKTSVQNAYTGTSSIDVYCRAPAKTDNRQREIKRSRNLNCN